MHTVNIIQRIKELIAKKGLTQSAFAKDIGVDQGNISAILNGKRKIGSAILNKIILSYDINKDWLLYGKGEMMKESEFSVSHIDSCGHFIFDFSSNHKTNIADTNDKVKYIANLKNHNGILQGAPLYADLPVSAGQYDVVSTSELPTGYINIPNVRVKWFFPVIGCSMEPEINAGDTVGVNYVENRNLLDPDKIYMIITPHERMIKRLRTDSDDKSIIWAISTNYKEIKLYSEDIKAIYHVVYVMKGKLL